jgi:putative salt-induced outer membrane protein YdiY
VVVARLVLALRSLGREPLTSRFDLKLSFADDYKTEPPVDEKKNDTAVLATVVFRV